MNKRDLSPSRDALFPKRRPERLPFNPGTYRRVLLVQPLLLGEEVQTLPQCDSARCAPLGHGQRQVAEHVKGVGVVGAHGAVQRAAQLTGEQVCRTAGRRRRRGGQRVTGRL